MRSLLGLAAIATAAARRPSAFLLIAASLPPPWPMLCRLSPRPTRLGLPSRPQIVIHRSATRRWTRLRASSSRSWAQSITRGIFRIFAREFYVPRSCALTCSCSCSALRRHLTHHIPRAGLLMASTRHGRMAARPLLSSPAQRPRARSRRPLTHQHRGPAKAACRATSCSTCAAP